MGRVHRHRDQLRTGRICRASLAGERRHRQDPAGDTRRQGRGRRAVVAGWRVAVVHQQSRRRSRTRSSSSVRRAARRSSSRRPRRRLRTSTGRATGSRSRSRRRNRRPHGRRIARSTSAISRSCAASTRTSTSGRSTSPRRCAHRWPDVSARATRTSASAGFPGRPTRPILRSAPRSIPT